MDDLYIEEFCAPLKASQAKEEAHQPQAISNQERQHTPYGYFLQLEKAILDECPEPEAALPYLKTIRKELERGNEAQILKLTDELEELLDLSLFHGKP